ncbi:hypothetical protein [Frigoriglobus tundricola]|uniref:Uncharacterized protein n=1 Tax=Frigoriglobus tundricola TaxID=2774151 RepID=A0A6M5YLR4_9BACT|nr:hypothetical protein [Frigoriglobus tundricola]QJW94191.1 hypothetical protein FTUN_1710 [Frigoriglobus tundricola]
MSKVTDLMKDDRSGGPAPTNEGVSRLFKEIGAELSHQAKAGAHEMAAALFRTHDGFVMYGREGKEDNTVEHGLPEAAKENDGIER